MMKNRIDSPQYVPHNKDADDLYIELSATEETILKLRKEIDDLKRGKNEIFDYRILSFDRDEPF
jgi:hypothetical protein